MNEEGKKIEKLLFGSIGVLFLLCFLEYSIQNHFVQAKWVVFVYHYLWELFKYFRVFVFVIGALACSRFSLAKQNFLDKTKTWQKIGIFLVWVFLLFLIFKGYSKSQKIYNLVFVPLIFFFETYLSILVGYMIPIDLPELGQKISFVFPKKPKNHYSLPFLTEQGKIFLLEPFRGTLITGNPGCAKTSTLIAQQMKGFIEKGFCGIIYDYKGFPPTLGRMAWNFLQDQKNPKPLIQFNLSAPCISKKINLLPSSEKNNPAYAQELISTLFGALQGFEKKEDYWQTTATILTSGAASFLMRNFPKFSTLPHLISLINSNSIHLLDLLALDQSIEKEIQAILEPYQLSAHQQLAGITSSAQAILKKLNLPEVFWLLSEEEEDLDINNPLHPKILNISSESEYRESYGAVCACIMAVVLKKMNKKNRIPSFVMIDEASTARFSGTTEIVAQGRENKIALTMVFQSKSQAIEVYGEKVAKNILTIPANQFFGALTDTEEAKKIADSFGQYDRKKDGFSMSDHGGNISINTQRENKVPVEKITHLKVGEFVSTIADAEEKFIAKYHFCNPKSDQEIPILYPSAFFTFENFQSFFEELIDFIDQNLNFGIEKIHSHFQNHFIFLQMQKLDEKTKQFFAFAKIQDDLAVQKKYNAFLKDSRFLLIEKIKADLLFLNSEFSSKNERKKELKKRKKAWCYLFYLELLNKEMAPKMAAKQKQIHNQIAALLEAYQKIKEKYLADFEQQLIEKNIEKPKKLAEEIFKNKLEEVDFRGEFLGHLKKMFFV